jgi:hypothetical protein
MNLGFALPVYAWLAALALPVVAFYLLKLKRERQEVPSLALWRKVLADQRVNSPFQRFRRHLSLWLALAALAALALAAMQPWWRSGPAPADRLPVLVDVSASMGARAIAGGPTRLDEARARVLALVERLGPGTSLCLVALGGQARRLTPFTDDRAELRRALDGLAVENAAPDLAGACRLLGAIARGEPCRRALLVTDGNLPAQVDAELPMSLDIERVAPGGANLGLTTLAARRTRDGRWEVLAQVEGSAQAERGGTLEIRRGDEVLGERAVAPGPLGAQRVAVTVAADAEQVLEVRLRPDGFDALAADDRACVALPRLRPLRAWVAPALATWRKAIAAQADVTMAEHDCDLVVTDRAEDLRRGAAVRLGVGVVPEALTALVAVGDGGSTVVDRRLGEPLLAHVGLGDLVIAEKVAWQAGAGEAEAERRGFTVLVHGDRGPLLVAAQNGRSRDLYLLFHSDRSTLPWRLGFPLLAGNLVDLARRLRGLDEAAARRTGTLTVEGCPPGAELRLEGPEVAGATATADAEGVVTGLPAPAVGVYHLTGPDLRRDLGTGLLDRGETRLESVDRLRLREVAVAADAPPAPAQALLWRWLALAALALLLFDWWWGNRRP